MKLFTCEQIKEIDAITIREEPVSSVDLMERASVQLFNWIAGRFDQSEHFIVFAGPGNNGGDGLALARILAENRYQVRVHCIKISESCSDNFIINLKRLEKVKEVTIEFLTSADQFPLVSPGDIIIDAIFGSGLSRPADCLTGEIIKNINMTGARKISIDIPSGLFGENNGNNNYECVIKADYTLSFQFPKLAFMFAENDAYAGEWFVLPIDLDKTAIRSLATPYYFLQNTDILPLIRKRHKFDHKGNFGHGLLVCGSTGKMGAAVLSAGAALRTGIGLITCHIPSSGIQIMQTAVPEAMVRADRSENFISEVELAGKFNAVGIGPGMGTEPGSQRALLSLLKECNKPVIIDADGLNILASDTQNLMHLPPGTILTPHPKEFERLAGKSSDGFQRLNRQLSFSRQHNCIVVLKGAHTSVTTPDGRVYFNSSGNPGMAKGGSGDVLTGIILSLLAQDYTSENAAISGVYLHGLAGDIAAAGSAPEAIIASDIINCIGKAFNRIRGK